MRCVIYCRVSTDAQERDGSSLDSQEQACLDYATKAGWQVTECLKDTGSGFALERPALERVRELMRRRDCDIVLTYAVDRLSRNQNHIGVLFDEGNQSGAKLDFVTEKFEDTAVGRFILAARAFVAEVEREKIVERTQRGKAERAKSGKLPQATGRGIFGYVYDPATGRRHIAEAEAATIRQVFSKFADGASCHGLACSLNDSGVPSFMGGRWYPLTIRRLLLNETYTGRTVFRRTKSETLRDGKTGKKHRVITERDSSEWIEIDGASPPIISLELYERVARILSDPERRNKSKPSRSYPLTGRLRCSRCNSPMIGQVLMKGRYSYYRCRRSYSGRLEATCDAHYVRTDALEGAVRTALMDLLANPERILEEVLRNGDADPSPDDMQPVLDALKDVEARQRRLVKLFTDGDLPQDLLEEQRRDLSRRRAELEAERARLESLRTPAFDVAKLGRDLPVLAKQIQVWVAEAEGENFDLLLRAVDVQIQAADKDVVIRGSVPLMEASRVSDLATIERTSA